MDNKILFIFVFLLFVNGEYVVMFSEFLNHEAQLSVLEDILPVDCYKWKLRDYESPVKMETSDFAVIDIFENVSDVVTRLKANSTSIRHVVPQRKLHNLLKAKKVGNPYTKKMKNQFVNSGMNANETYLTISGRPHTTIMDDDTQHVQYSRRLHTNNYDVADLLDAPYLWKFGHKGENVKVAIFDTGLDRSYSKVSNIVEVIDWTNDQSENDYIGHGTFVTGVISSHDPECKGLAPEAEIYIFRVFTNEQVSYTTWFLDAFNYAIYLGIDVLNLSIGGPDFNDIPFVEKIRELSANNIITISAIGNDGPSFGSLNNPADQSDVIGVGGVDFSGRISSFSSRGMTLWELPNGIGRFKPDLVTFSKDVLGSHNRGGCTTLSGTSVASPIVAGSTALLLSTVPEEKKHIINPASIKQVLVESALLYSNSFIFMEGAGQLSLVDAYHNLQKYVPKITAIPEVLDMTSSYMWPYNIQPIYHSSMPLKVNVTILNGMSVSSTIISTEWIPGTHGDLLELSFSHNNILWPWSGNLGISVQVQEKGDTFEGEIAGVVQVTIKSPPVTGTSNFRNTTLKIPIKVQVIPTPPREKRILWDQYHSIAYPKGYYPRDALWLKNVPFDWNGDHLYTNFHFVYENLRKDGYYVEILGEPFTCFNGSNYGVLMIVDPEREFHEREIEKLIEDVDEGLSVVVLADWYDTDVLDTLKIMDENTQQWWIPETGGSNIPAVNDLLHQYGIAFGDKVYDGTFTISSESAYFASGNAIMSFPKGGILVPFELQDQSSDLITGKKVAHVVPIIGFYQTINANKENPGRIAVFGDSSCMDEANQLQDSNCLWLLTDLIQFTAQGELSPRIKNYKPLHNDFLSKRLVAPVRYHTNIPQKELQECENPHFVYENKTTNLKINWDTKNIKKKFTFFENNIILHNFNARDLVFKPIFIPILLMTVALFILIGVVLVQRSLNKANNNSI